VSLATSDSVEAAPPKPWPIRRHPGLNFANGKPAGQNLRPQPDTASTATCYYASGAGWFRPDFARTCAHRRPARNYPNGKPWNGKSYLHGELNGRCRYATAPSGTLEKPAAAA
jgi:hypothetical protein